MRKKLIIGFAYDLSSDYKLKAGEPRDKYSEFDTKDIIRDIKRAIECNGFGFYDLGNFSHILSSLDKIKCGVDIVFNLAEGLNGRNREAQAPLILEYAGIPFVGSDALSMSLMLDKAITKKVLIAENIPTPKFFVTDRIIRASDMPFAFPMIVKPRWEGSSKGITNKSKVNNFTQLNKQIRAIVNQYHQPVLVESFIAGREMTVGLIGNGETVSVLPPLEIKIRGASVGNRLFIGRYVYSDDVKYISHSLISKKLTQNILLLAKRTYLALECRDFGRVDFRVDKKDNPYVLEINPLPALSREDAFGALAKTIGISYDAIIGKIIDAAILRHPHLRKKHMMRAR